MRKSSLWTAAKIGFTMGAVAALGYVICSDAEAAMATNHTQVSANHLPVASAQPVSATQVGTLDFAVTRPDGAPLFKPVGVSAYAEGQPVFSTQSHKFTRQLVVGRYQINVMCPPEKVGMRPVKVERSFDIRGGHTTKVIVSCK